MKSVDFEKKLQFLLTVLDSEEKRRASVENRLSVLIASNAILLSVIVNLGFPSINTNFPAFWIQISLSAIALIAIVFSTLWGAQILTAIGGQKKRAQIMDLGKKPESEYNLILFTRISKYKKSEYLDEINSLSEQKFLEQISSQVHNVSRLLERRYKDLTYSHNSFVIAIIAFTILVFVNLYFKQ